ncbi:hypothetical protein M5K25_023180 [Dendrobium thyrsiflorum]|uniref:Uncharacterized protein n=1 Tax=Dendrobium thyrsiflorum TaxID=117978 RepID=A0ABD0U844_DENTH
MKIKHNKEANLLDAGNKYRIFGEIAGVRYIVLPLKPLLAPSLLRIKWIELWELERKVIRTGGIRVFGDLFYYSQLMLLLALAATYASSNDVLPIKKGACLIAKLSSAQNPSALQLTNLTNGNDVHSSLLYTMWEDTNSGSSDECNDGELQNTDQMAIT